MGLQQHIIFSLGMATVCINIIAIQAVNSEGYVSIQSVLTSSRRGQLVLKVSADINSDLSGSPTQIASEGIIV